MGEDELTARLRELSALYLRAVDDMRLADRTAAAIFQSGGADEHHTLRQANRRFAEVSGRYFKVLNEWMKRNQTELNERRRS